MKEVRLVARCKEGFAMNERQRNTHSKGTVTALAALLLAACTFLAGPLQAQESNIKGLKPGQSSIQGVVTASGPVGQSTPLEGITLKV